MAVERELQEIREKLGQVDNWKKRHDEIEAELAKVWVAGSDENLAAPDYVDDGEKGKDSGVMLFETDTEETQDEAEYQEAQEEVGDETESETETEVDAGAGASEGVVEVANWD